MHTRRSHASWEERSRIVPSHPGKLDLGEHSRISKHTGRFESCPLNSAFQRKRAVQFRNDLNSFPLRDRVCCGHAHAGRANAAPLFLTNEFARLTVPALRISDMAGTASAKMSHRNVSGATEGARAPRTVDYLRNCRMPWRLFSQSMAILGCCRRSAVSVYLTPIIGIQAEE